MNVTLRHAVPETFLELLTGSEEQRRIGNTEKKSKCVICMHLPRV